VLNVQVLELKMENSSSAQNVEVKVLFYKMFKLVLECKCKCKLSVQNARVKEKPWKQNAHIVKENELSMMINTSHLKLLRE
jgi:hypothetical protein